MTRASHLFTDEIAFAPYDGRVGGDPQEGATQVVAARVEDEIKLVVDPDKNERMSNHKITTDCPIPLESFVWLPGDDRSTTNSSRRPITSRSASTPNGSLRLFETWL